MPVISKEHLRGEEVEVFSTNEGGVPTPQQTTIERAMLEHMAMAYGDGGSGSSETVRGDTDADQALEEQWESQGYPY